MPGVGTKTAITTNRPTARCLDLTRLISRVGRGPWTGVDRVEFAYLRQLVASSTPLFLIVKTSLGFVLLDRRGAQRVLARLEGDESWGQADFLAKLTRNLSQEKRRAEADLRRLCLARCLSRNLGKMLAKHLPAGCAYLNVGHSNLSETVMAAVRKAPDAQISVLVHDTIPLDLPHFQRPGTPEAFEQKLKTVFQNADLIICNSAQTERDVARWAVNWGYEVTTLVAHLGLDLKGNDRVTPTPDITHPYFVCLGTIEPRKNHALLLDVWEAFHVEHPLENIPHLYIVGTRGWSNEAVFNRLDNAEFIDQTVFERSGLNDDALAKLMANAAGMLFPSVAEGYGLPPAEAISLNVPVICTNLPVYAEILGNIPVYLSPDDVYEWKQSILRIRDEKQAGQTKNVRDDLTEEIPTWATHFNLVLKMT